MKKTKDAIRESFVELLNEKPLSKITVRDIVERCGVNRNSFYYHFQDIPSLVEEIVTDSMAGIIAEYPEIDSVEMAFTAVIEFAEKNRRAAMHIYQSANRDIFEQHLWSVCDYVVETYAKSLFEGKRLPAADREIIVSSYKAECFGMVMDWISGGMKGDARAKVRRFCELRRGTAEEMVRRSLETGG